MRIEDGERRNGEDGIADGEYRIVYTVDDEVLVVAIERVRHRREVYR